MRLPLRYHDGGEQLLTSRPPHPVTLSPPDEASEAIDKNACVGHALDLVAGIRVTLPHRDRTRTMEPNTAFGTGSNGMRAVSFSCSSTWR